MTVPLVSRAVLASAAARAVWIISSSTLWVRELRGALPALRPDAAVCLLLVHVHYYPTEANGAAINMCC